MAGEGTPEEFFEYMRLIWSAYFGDPGNVPGMPDIRVCIEAFSRIMGEMTEGLEPVAAELAKGRIPYGIVAGAASPIPWVRPLGQPSSSPHRHFWMWFQPRVTSYGSRHRARSSARRWSASPRSSEPSNGQSPVSSTPHLRPAPCQPATPSEPASPLLLFARTRRPGALARAAAELIELGMAGPLSTAGVRSNQCVVPRMWCRLCGSDRSQEGNDVREYEVAAQERADVTEVGRRWPHRPATPRPASTSASLSSSPATSSVGA